MKYDEYLRGIQENRVERFHSLIDLVKLMYPAATLSMKYKMPTFTYKEGWISIANQKHYISLYTCGAHHLESFKAKHPEIKTGKGCINFKDKDEIPLQDLKPVIMSALESGHGH
ncbi:MAG: DUF1801 domain-containing protein [Gammaproteobacteria bacterium]